MQAHVTAAALLIDKSLMDKVANVTFHSVL
jgi:hypothetical protein